MRKVTLANSLGRSLPLTTAVVMKAQQEAEPLPVEILAIAPGVEYPIDYLGQELSGNRQQRRVRLKELRRAKG